MYDAPVNLVSLFWVIASPLVKAHIRANKKSKQKTYKKGMDTVRFKHSPFFKKKINHVTFCCIQ